MKTTSSNHSQIKSSRIKIWTIASVAVLLGAAGAIKAADKTPPPKIDIEDESLESTPIDATITYCSDGDTCRVVTSPGKLWVNVRLAGIDAPEVVHKRSKNKPGQAGGEAAREFLQGAIQGKKVTVKQSDLDQYNRPVVEIFIDGKNINLELVSKGFAEAYRGKTKRIDTKSYFNAETEAKTAKLGIWGMATYESPSDFRKKNR